MALSATQALPLAKKNVATMLSNSATFKTWVEAANAAAALANIIVSASDAATMPSPFALIFAKRFHREKISQAPTWRDHAEIRIIFGGVVPAEYESNEAQAVLWWEEKIGAIQAELEPLSEIHMGQLVEMGITEPDMDAVAEPMRASAKRKNTSGLDTFEQELYVRY